MGWLDRRELDATPRPEEVGVPLRLVRQLVLAGGLRFDSRVLEMTAGASQLAPVLADLGIETVTLRSSRSRIPGSEIPPTGPRELATRKPQPEAAGFDLALLHADEPFFADLRARPVREVTEACLARLTPGGRLILLAARDDEGYPAGHERSCLVGHLERYAGTVSSREVSAGFVWRRLRKPNGADETQGWFLAILETPSQREEGVARNGAGSLDAGREGTCCPRAMTRSAFNRHRRAA